jgi:hypothetical protein
MAWTLESRCTTCAWTCEDLYRGFERKGDRVLGYNIIVVTQQY